MEIDYEMFIEADINAEEVQVVKIIKIEEKKKEVQNLAQVRQNEKQEGDMQLTIQGQTEDGSVIFLYSHKELTISQSFGVNIKKYIAHQKYHNQPSRMFVAEANYTEAEQLNNQPSEGAYTFRPEWYDQMPHNYSNLDEDITYQTGKMLEQWTILYHNSETEERAIITVRFSPLVMLDMIEMEVQLAPVPVKDGLGKDITVNWSFYDQFDANGTFWTDSNGLEMQERHIKVANVKQSIANNRMGYNYATIGGNYYPVDSAIAMRDRSGISNLQVTVLTDRAQGGSADLSSKATIELMQHRRILLDDTLGVEEYLNETDVTDGMGIKVTAKYWI